MGNLSYYNRAEYKLHGFKTVSQMYFRCLSINKFNVDCTLNAFDNGKDYNVQKRLKMFNNQRTNSNTLIALVYLVLVDSLQNWT